jgi:hypothetical protein
MTTNFTDISTDIVYLGNLGNQLADVQNFSPGGLATRTQLLLTKTIVTDNGTNYTVTAISDNAFQNNFSLQSVDFSGMGQLTSIGSDAFTFNTSLTELKNFTNATNLLSIGIRAFAENEQLQSVDFGGMGQLTSICNNAFLFTTKLTEIKNFTNAIQLKSIGDLAFYHNFALQSVDFGGMGQLTHIGNSAFYRNLLLTELKNFTKATKLQTIGSAAFFNNTSLQLVDFGGMGDLTSIAYRAFDSNTSLTELKNFTKATKLKAIGTEAFNENYLLKSVDFSGMGQLTSIGNEAFFSNISLTELNFGNLSQTALQIAASAFNSAISLRQIYYQDTAFLSILTSISGGEKHMYIQRNTTNNTILTIDFQKAGNLTSINPNEFTVQRQLSKLNNFTNATNLQSIGFRAFFSNIALQSVDFGGMGQLTSIGGSAFYFNTVLTELKNFTKATNLLSIGVVAFAANYALQSVDFGGMGQLTSIGISAFSFNTALTELKNFTNATNLLSIGTRAFQNNIAVQSVDFGGMGQLTSIGSNALSSNTALTELKNFTNATNLLSIGSRAFQDNYSLQSVDFGGMGQLTNIGGLAFDFNTSLTELNFGNLSQTNLQIESNAFNSAISLRQIYYQDTALLSNLTSISGGEKHMYIQRNTTNNTILTVDFQKAGNLTSINTDEFTVQRQLSKLNNFTNATNLQSIGVNAFDFNYALQSVDFSGMRQLTSIGSNAFFSDIALTELNFGNLSQTNLQIAANAFNSAISLRQIYYQDTAFLTKLTSISGGEKHMYIQRNTTNNTILTVDFQKAGNLTSINTDEFTVQRQLSKLNNFTNATNLKSIGDNAFQENIELQSLDFSGMDQLTNIGSQAFFSAIALTELNFGNLSQTNLQIADTAFNSVISLRQVYYQDTDFLTKLTSISGGEKHMYIQRNTTNNTILTIDFQKAGNLTSINANEFEGQSQLSKLNNFTNATNLLSIGLGAFASNSVLQSVDFGGMGQLTSIGGSAFYFNTALTELKNFTNAVQLKAIGDQAFSENYALQSVDFGGMGQLTSIGIEAFYLNTALIALNNFNYATSLKTINEGVFDDCSSIQTIFFPTGLIDIQADAFYSNISLRNITFNDPTPTSIAANAFANCTSLKSIYHYGTGISQLTQLTALANGTLYDLSQDKVDYADYDTHLASAFNNYDITNQVQISDIKNIYAANLIQIALNGTIFDPALSNIQVKVGSIPFVAEQLDASPTDTLILYPNYTTPNNRYIIAANTDPVYIQMNLGSVLYLNTNETITKNADNTYTYSGAPSEVYQPGDSLTIEGRRCVFGGVLISGVGGDIPTSDICFPAGTPIQTDQGFIPINELDKTLHTINNQLILHITKTITLDKYLISFSANSISENVPNETTIMTKNHKIMFQGNLVPAKHFLEYSNEINKVDYRGEPLYNVLLENYSTIQVNGITCETLDPENIIAKLYMNKYNEEDRVMLIKELNVINKKLNEINKEVNIINKELNVINKETVNYNTQQVAYIMCDQVNAMTRNKNLKRNMLLQNLLILSNTQNEYLVKYKKLMKRVKRSKFKGINRK